MVVLGGILLSLLLSMLGCVDGQGVFAQNRTVPKPKMYANRKLY